MHSIERIKSTFRLLLSTDMFTLFVFQFNLTRYICFYAASQSTATACSGQGDVTRKGYKIESATGTGNKSFPQTLYR
jgi:hypothetical protein